MLQGDDFTTGGSNENIYKDDKILRENKHYNHEHSNDISWYITLHNSIAIFGMIFERLTCKCNESKVRSRQGQKHVQIRFVTPITKNVHCMI